VPVAPAQQRAAIAAVLAPLRADALRVPPALVPLLSAAQNSTTDRQYETEIFATAGGPVFDPLVAADAAAQLTVQTLLAPRRLARLVVQSHADPSAPGVGEVIDRLTDTVLGQTSDDLGRRIAYRTFATMAQVARRGDATPEVAAALDQQLADVAALLAKRKATGAERAWALSLSRHLADSDQREQLAASLPRMVSVPPGDPIGEDDWMNPASLLAPGE
jgi:hypothetical protein